MCSSLTLMKFRHFPLVLAIALASSAQADEYSRNDKLRLLYSNQFAFDRQGVPVISIAIAEGLDDVIIEGKTALRVLPDGEGGAELVSGKKWKITLSNAKPAQLAYYVVLAREPASGLATLRKEMATWQARKARCQLIEIGTVFGSKGQVFDNRGYLLADGPYPDRQHATQAAERYQRQYKLEKIQIFPQLKSRPSAVLKATAGKTRVQAHDAIWFAPPRKGGQISVRVGKGPVARYWGQVYVTVDRRGKLAVVNALNAEKMLNGLVPAEIFPNAPANALRAQAVAARGDLLAKLGARHLADPYLICSWQHCQVYKGIDREHASTSHAVKSTRGKVLLRKDGRLIKAVYSASCGGHSEHNEMVWPASPDPTLRGRRDADSSQDPYAGGIDEQNIDQWLSSRPKSFCGNAGYNKDKFRWTVTLSQAKLQTLLKRFKLGKIKGIRVLKRGRSGRARLVEITGSKGAVKISRELTIRRTFNNLRSSMFVVTAAGNRGGVPAKFEFKGGGWGHGVGMCQTGAIGMAQGGKNYLEILKHYYTGSEIRGVY
jgi:stage II sporulation protein D